MRFLYFGRPSWRPVFLLGAAVFFCKVDESHASGLYFSDRGVRPMGRGGAFVAGADDAGSIWYNPAGLADAGTSLLIDASYLHFSSAYSRELRVVDADNTVRHVTSPTVRGSAPFLPIPTAAVSFAIDRKQTWTLGAGVVAPYVALANYPDVVQGQPSPARYALGSFAGSVLAIPGLWVAYKPAPFIRFGVGIQALVGVFKTTVTFSASPQDRLLGAPEQPEFDSQSRLSVGPIIAPTANAGVIIEPVRWVRVGISGQLPMTVSADATLKVRLGSSVAFDGARVSGETAHVRFRLPGILRFGIEGRPTESTRIEVAYVREFWSAHRAIDAQSVDIAIDGIVGAPPSVAMPPIGIPRNFVDSNSFRLGVEQFFDIGQYRIDARLGAAYETSAVPPAYLSLSSLDFSKLAATAGLGFHIGRRWRLDAVYAHYFMASTRVGPEIAKIPRINPLSGNAPAEFVNGGKYSANADLFGVGVNVTF